MSGIILDDPNTPRPVQIEQLQLFETTPPPEFNSWARRPITITDRAGRVFRWHEPVTEGRYKTTMFVVYAMPSKIGCDRGCPVKTPNGNWGYAHYHCYQCGNRIEYGELHGGSTIHVCVNCLLRREWGPQEVPDYGY